MKKFKLMLVAMLAMFGFNNAMADAIYAVDGNVIYKSADTPVGEGTEAKPYQVSVAGLKAEVTSLEIPASFSKTDLKDNTSYFIVTGFGANWDKTATVDGVTTKNVDGIITTLTIHADKMDAGLANAFTNLTKLETLTIAGASESWTNTGYVTGPLVTGNAKIKETLKTLDLSGLSEKCVTVSGTSNTFTNLPALTSVTLSEGIKTIGADAFKGLAITEITLPSTVEMIEHSAFKNTKITGITLPDALKEIAYEAFENVPLTAVAIPAKVTAIGNYAFNGCAELASVDLSAAAALKSIGNAAFKGTKKLEAIDFANVEELTTIGAEAFAGSGLKSITIPETVEGKNADQKVFENCEALTTATVNLKTNKLENCWFRGCTALESITLGENIEVIGAQAFKGCEKLKTVTISSEKFYAIQGSAFEGCEALESLDLSNTKFNFNASYTDVFKGCTALAEIKLPETVTTLIENTFADAIIEELDLSETGVTTWAKIFGTPTAEKPNTTLKVISLPAVTIGEGAFNYFTALQTVNYKNPATTGIDVKAFIGCTPFITINTTAAYIKSKESEGVPTNAKWGEGATLKVKKTVKDKTGEKYYMYFTNTEDTPAIFNAADAKMYSVYTDQGTAYFQSLITVNGKYIVKKGECVVLKTDEAKEVEYVLETSTDHSVLISKVFVGDGKSVADFQNGTNIYKYVVNGSDSNVSFTNGKDYVYRLTNTAANGFGFTYYAGENLNAGQFFIVSTLAPASASARLNSVWLDENGNVESAAEATAIQGIEAESENSTVYNLQGVRVNGAQKGVYIQNGKKFIVK